MTISYPRALPGVKDFSAIELRQRVVTGLSGSPFTLAEQSFDWPGARWEADLSLPAMARADAEVWIAWLFSLRGRSKTFLLGDPRGATPRGSARDSDGITVSGAGQTGDSLALTGADPSTSNVLRAGDYVQLGSGSTARLHKVLEDADSDVGGNLALDIWPPIVSAPANGAAVTLEGARGVFRLVSDVTGFSVNTAALYGLTFGAESKI